MKLLLCSQAPTKNFSLQFESCFNAPIAGMKVAYIPNARDLTKLPIRIHATMRRLQIQALGFDVEEVDLLKVQGATLKEVMKDKDVIWMHGGMAMNLMRAINKSGLGEFLPELLEKGLRYVGSSAGSMIASPTLETAEWFIGEEEPGARDLKGLGYVDFHIYPHFREELKPKIQKFLKPNLHYYFLQDGEAVAYDNGKVKVHGF